jgi:transcriptional regulator with XRE-family HTH domain
MADFRASIKKAIALRKSSVTKTAKAAGISRTHLSGYLGGKSGISVDVLERVFEELGIACAIALSE